MAESSRILGVCGAPCTGKTTLARWLAGKLGRLGADCVLLPELARILVDRGIKIDKEMGEADYDAFLDAYIERESGIQTGIAVADRTLIDHYSYLAVNRNMPPELVERHRQSILDNVHLYRKLVYIPVELPMKDDGFRETSKEYQRSLDKEISGLLKLVECEVVTIRGPKKVRRQLAVETAVSAWPEMFEQKTLQAGA